MPAMITGISSTARNAVMLADRSGTVLGVALCHVTGEAHFRHALKAGIIGWEILIELASAVAEFFGDGLSAIHGKNSMPFLLLVVKG